MKLGIIGSGGFGRETLLLARDITSSTQSFYDDIFFIEFDEFFRDEVVDNVKVFKTFQYRFAKLCLLLQSVIVILEKSI